MGSSAFPHEELSVLTPQESELSKKRKKCQSLELEARKKQRRCEELVSSEGLPEASSPVPQASQVVAPSPLCFYPSCPEEHTFPVRAGLLPWLMQASRSGRKAWTGRAGPLCGEGRNVGARLPPQSSSGLSGIAAERSPE